MAHTQLTVEDLDACTVHDQSAAYARGLDLFYRAHSLSWADVNHHPGNDNWQLDTFVEKLAPAFGLDDEYALYLDNDDPNLERHGAVDNLLQGIFKRHNLDLDSHYPSIKDLGRALQTALDNGLSEEVYVGLRQHLEYLQLTQSPV